MKMKKINFLNLTLLLVTSYNLQCAHPDEIEPDEIEIDFFDDTPAAQQEDELTKLTNKISRPKTPWKSAAKASNPNAASTAGYSTQPKGKGELNQLINKSKEQSSSSLTSSSSSGSASTATAVTKQYSLTPQHQSQVKQNNDATQKQSKSARMAEKSVSKIFQFTGSALASLQITGALSAAPLTIQPLPQRVEQELEKLLDYEINIEKAINSINQDEFKKLLESIKVIEPKKIIRIKNLIEDKIMELRSQAIGNNDILLAAEEKPGQHNLAKSENINLQQKILALEGFKDILRAQIFNKLKAVLENINIHRVINVQKINDLFEVIESINIDELESLDRLVDNKISQMKTSRLGAADQKLNVDILNDNIRDKIVTKRKQ